MAYPYGYPMQPAAVYQYASGYRPTSSGHDIRQPQSSPGMAYPYGYSTPQNASYYARVAAGQMPTAPPYAYYPQHISSGVHGATAPPYYAQPNGGGGVFNRWPGAPEEDVAEEDMDRRRGRSRREHGSRQDWSHGHAAVPTYSPPAYRPPSYTGSNEYIDLDGTDDDESCEVVIAGHDGGHYHIMHEDAVADSLRSRRLCLALAGREEIAYGSGGGGGGGGDDDGGAGELVREVTVHPGGSGRVVMHVDSEPPRLTSFRVSARRMRSEAQSWARVCHRGTDACDTTVGDETAIAAMYWLLRVLHEDEEDDQAAAAAAEGFRDSDYDERRRLRDRAVRAAVPIPQELPARVLAYVVMFGLQLGALGRSSSGGSAAAAATAAAAHVRHERRPAASGRPSRLLVQAEAWLWAATSRRRDRHVLDVSTVDDWPYLLYAARSLGNQQMIQRCLQMLTWDR